MNGPMFIKTEYSLLTSMIRIPELISFAKELGLSTLGIADSTTCGAYEFYKACKVSDIKPIIGLEVIYNDYSIILYAKDINGYRNLNHLSTIQSKEKIVFEDLEKYNQNLIAILPYESKPLYLELNKIYSEIYIGYQTEVEKQGIKEKSIFFPKICSLKSIEKNYLRYLEAVRRGVLLEEVQGEVSFSLEESIQSNDSTVLKEIATEIDINIESTPDLLPLYECPTGMNQQQYLTFLCKEGLKKRFGNTVNRTYIERVKYELEIINRMGFCNYFLVVWDYVHYAKEHDILVGPGRGSAAGSLIAYCLEITDIDPMAYNLLFERFLNPERITMPDIDMDFEYIRREEIIRYCIDKYGEKRVAGIITYGTLGAKQVVRDVGRVMNLSLKQVDILCKYLNATASLKENYEHNSKIREFIEYDPDFQRLYQVSMKLEGLKRHTSIHAAGIVMCRKDLDDVIPLVYHDSMYLTGYSMNYLEELGLLKMDFLALKTLTTIQNVLTDINKEIKLSFSDIPLEDEKAIQIFYDVNTMGIFQFESRGMMNFLQKLKPNSFEDVVAALALYRPGPMGNIDHYIRRKQGKEKIDYFHDDLVPILKPTYGILIYQEQIMQVANVMAGYSLGEADVLRRAMSKKKEEVLLKERKKFISRSIQKGYSEELSNTIYDLILKFADYGFNRSHSVAYAVISIKMAYLKAYYPAYFMKSLLTESIGKSIDTKDYIYECKLNHLEVLKPDINFSNYEYIVDGTKIRFPLTGIKNCGESAVRNILSERVNGLFLNIYDFIKRTYGKSVNKKTLESLIFAGCFDSFEFNKKTLMENLDVIVNYGELVRNLSEEFALKPELDLHEEYGVKELMKQELDVFGFYLSNHPVMEYRLKENTPTLDQLELYFDRIISVVVIVDHVKEIVTKKNDKMVFITGSDEISSIDIVLFPKTYEKYSFIEAGMILKITGKVEKRFDKYQLVTEKIDMLENS